MIQRVSHSLIREVVEFVETLFPMMKISKVANRIEQKNKTCTMELHIAILAVREICRACTTFSSRMHAHAHARSPNREKDPYELFAVGELLGPGCEFPVVYIESNREDRPTSR